MSRIGNFLKSRPLLSAAMACGVLFAGAGTVSAQYGGWGGPHGGGWRGHHEGRGMGMGMERGGMRGMRLERFCSMESARWAPVMRAWVKADLNLTPPQAAEFDKLADTAHPAMEQIRGEVCGNFGPNAPKLTAPERLEKASGTMRKAADALDKAVAPAKSFYATLDEQQKARVEQLLERRGRGGMNRGWRGRDRDRDRGGADGQSPMPAPAPRP